MQIHLRKDAEGFHVVSGLSRLQAALSMADEVKVDAPGLGDVLIVKLPDGCFVATQDTETLALFGLR